MLPQFLRWSTPWFLLNIWTIRPSTTSSPVADSSLEDPRWPSHTSCLFCFLKRNLKVTTNFYSSLPRFALQGDAGVTGRKIIVDTYGGWGAHGGGAFSGKDFSKVDRSAAYAARWVAKSLVKAKLCRRVLVQVSAQLLSCKHAADDCRLKL